ncbi:MAG: hypothetical protein M1840_004818 [Geoglossum simile]|nr:MAG: hypothetical protein M1840_004818 [Geoglossum simile]
MQSGNFDHGEEEPLTNTYSSGYVPGVSFPSLEGDDGLETDSDISHVPGVGAPDHHHPPRSLTFLNGLALVIGIQVGAGIFSSPSAVVNNVGSPGLAMLVWLLAGILAWTGAASFIELGSIVPLNGGVQEYLRYIYHEAFGFLAAWTWILVVKPCSVAIVSLIFSEYLNKVFTMLDNDNPSVWAMKGIALLTVVSVTYLNCIGTRVSAGTANVFLVLKLLGLGSIIVTGVGLLVVHFERRHEAQRTTLVDGGSAGEIGEGIWAHIGGYTDATLAALWAYSGWESLGLVAGELKDPLRNLPRVLSTAMALVITVFILANMAYFVVLPLDALGKTNTVAMDFGRAVFGPGGALFYAWVVCLSCLGALNVKIFTAGRLTEAAVRRNYLPTFLTSFSNPLPSLSEQDMAERGHPTGPTALSTCGQRLFRPEKNSSVPIAPMVLNAFLSMVYVAIGSFRSLLIFTGMAEYVMLFSAVAGILVLRYRSRFAGSSCNPSPIDPIPLIHHRTYIINPLIYCIVSAFVIIRSAAKHPLMVIAIVVFYGVGLGVYRSRNLWQSVKTRSG